MEAPDPEPKWEPPVSTDIELVARQELAQQAVVAISEAFDGLPVTVSQLLTIAQEPEPSAARLGARRALRAVEAIGRPDSPVIRAIGKVGIYNYVEGVVVYGAAEWRYLGLMKDYNLTAEEATALYEIRRQVAEHTNDKKPGFDQLIAALQSIGIDPHQAAIDTEAAVSSLEQAGFFVGYVGGKVFDSPAFMPEFQGKSPLTHHPDSVRSQDSMMWVREEIERGAIILEETEDE